jgi:predicted PurR-regulated permease PerM
MDGNDRQFSIQLSTIFKIAFVVAICYFGYLLRDVLLSILTAVVIASALEPVTRWLERRSVPRTLAVLGIYLFIGAVVAFLFYLMAPVLLNDVMGTLAELPRYTKQFLHDANPISAYFAPLIPAADSLQNGVFFTASSFFGGTIQFFFITVLSFYLAAQRYGVTNFLRIIVPIQHEPYIIDLWNRSQRKIGRWMQGQLILALIMGLLTYVALSIMGFEKALLLAVISGVCELIPIFGPIIAAMPAIVFGFIDGGVGTALIVLAVYVLIQQIESQIIHPLVVNKMVGIPPIVSIIALVVGGTVAGFLGIVIAVPVAAGLMEYLTDLEKQKYS